VGFGFQHSFQLYRLLSKFVFTGLGCQPNAQPRTWRTRVSLLVWNLTLDLSGLGDPASSYATAGIALEIIGTRKPHRYDKAETPPGGNTLFSYPKSYGFRDSGRKVILCRNSRIVELILITFYIRSPWSPVHQIYAAYKIELKNWKQVTERNFKNCYAMSSFSNLSQTTCIIKRQPTQTEIFHFKQILLIPCLKM
jgi:hypothetical protein